MTTLHEAAQQALEAMEKATRYMSDSDYRKLNEAIEVLQAALAEPEPRNQCGETCERAKLRFVQRPNFEPDGPPFIRVLQQWRDAEGDEREDIVAAGGEWQDVPLEVEE